MANAYLAPFPRFQQFSNNGGFLIGGQLFTYAGGSSVPIATWTDSTATVANPNPVILDSRGSASVFLIQNTSYKFVLEDAAGNVIWTVDNIVNAVLITYYGVDAGAANTYIVTALTPYTTYQNGQIVFFVPSYTNTGASTININGLGPIPITSITGAVLGAGQITAGIMTELIYFNGAFQLLSIGNTFGSTVGTFGTEVPIASAATTDIGSTPNHNVLITGTSTITSLGASASLTAPIYVIRFASSLTITYNSATMLLPGGASIVTMGGDAAMFEYLGSGSWKCLIYQSSGGQQNSKIKPADTVLISTTTLTPDPDLQTNTLAIGRYSYEIYLCFDSVASGAGFKWTNDGTAVDSRGASPALAYGFVNSGAYGPKAETPYGTTITYASVSTGSNSNEVIYKGSLLVGTVGTFGVSWAQGISTASSTTLRAGSYLTTTLLNTGTANNLVQHTYTTAGTFTETVPTGYNTLTLEVWGASGGGGGGFQGGSGNVSGGGGGASGSYARSTIVVTGLGGDTFTLTVGTAGTFSSAGTASSAATITLPMTAMNSPGGGGGQNASGLANGGAGGVPGGIATGGTLANSNGNSGGGGANNAGGGTGGPGGTGVSGINGGGGSGGLGGSGLGHGFVGSAGLVIASYSV